MTTLDDQDEALITDEYDDPLDNDDTLDTTDNNTSSQSNIIINHIEPKDKYVANACANV